jgi:hypothetical protein
MYYYRPLLLLLLLLLLMLLLWELLTLESRDNRNRSGLRTLHQKQKIDVRKL